MLGATNVTAMGGGGCRLRSGRRRILRGSDPSGRLQAPQLEHVFLMLLVGLGEDMAASAVGDEVKMRVRAGLVRPLERTARIGDRARRQTVDLIGVIGVG